MLIVQLWKFHFATILTDMILKELKERIAGVTSIGNGDKLLHKIQIAANEIWETVDLPGCLMEDYYVIGENNYITLPYHVGKIRGVKPLRHDFNTTLNSMVPAYFDNGYRISPWRARILRTTPLVRDIGEASTLVIKARKPVSGTVLISIAGPTDLAARGSETLGIDPGDSEVETDNRYTDLNLLVKDVKTATDLDVYNAAGEIVALLPNNLLEARNTLIQIWDNGETQLGNYSVAVLYKPTLPPLVDDLDSFPDPYAHALELKIIEYFMIESADKLEQASVFAIKSDNLIGRFSADAERGLTQPFNIKRSRFNNTRGWTGL